MNFTLRPLVEAAQAGDRDALDQLAGCVDRFVRIFHGKLSRRVRRSQGSTIDFVLEGMAHALAGIERFRYESDEHFYAWIASSIRGRMADAWRGEARQKRAGRPGPIGEGDFEPVAGDPSVSRIVSDAELRERVGGAILDLQVAHADEMEAVVLKLFEDATWPRIRAVMGLRSDHRARTLFARGIDRLRPCLESALGEGSVDAIIGG